MGTVRVACPHCDFSRDVPQEKLPAGRVRVTCPKCRKPFVFEADEIAGKPQQAVPPVNKTQQRPVSSALHQPEQPAHKADSVNIACPNCDYSRDVPREKLKSRRVRVTCPKCREPFIFDTDENEDAQKQPPQKLKASGQAAYFTAPEPPEPPAPPEPQAPPEQTEPPEPPKPPEPSEDDNEFIKVSCPSCGFSKDVPQAKVPAGSTSISCPRCGHGFAFTRPGPHQQPSAPDISAARPQEHEQTDEEAAGPPVMPPAAEDAQPPATAPVQAEDTAVHDLPYSRVAGHAGIGALLADAWYSFRKRAFTLYGLLLLVYLLPLLTASAVAAGSFLLAVRLPEWQAYIFAAGTVISGLAFTGLAGMTFGGLIHAVSDERLGIIDALSAGRISAWSIVWVWLLLFYMVAGGTLFFVVPGIVFAVWFAFSFFVLVAEGETGMSALIRSGYYVRGRWFGVFGRLLIVWLVSLAGAVPIIGLFITFILSPLILVYLHKVYLDLAAAKPAGHSPGLGERLKWTAAGASGFALAAVLLVVYAPPLSTIHGMSLDRLEKHSGLFHLSKISLPRIRHTGPGGELEKAYFEYRDALETGDMAGLKQAVTPETAGLLGGVDGRDMAQMLLAAAPEIISVSAYNMEGDEAMLFVEGERGGETIKGEVTFLRQSDAWKVAKESWDKAPRPASLVRGGEDVPVFDPIEPGLLSPAVGGAGAPFRFFDPDDMPQRMLALTGHEEAVSGLAFSPDGTRLLSSSHGGSYIRLWEVDTGKQLDYHKLDDRPVSIALVRGGKISLVTDDAGNVSLITVGQDRFVSGQVAEASLGSGCRMAVSPNGRLFATASLDGKVTIWDIENTKELRRFETARPMRAIEFSPSGRLLAAGGAGGKLTIWDMAAGVGGTYTASVVSGGADISAIDIGPDSSMLVTGQTDGSITVWDAGTQQELLRRRESNASITDVKYSPDGAVFVTAHSDGKISVWDSATADKLTTLSGQEGGSPVLVFSPDGRFLASGGADKRVAIWRGSAVLTAPASEDSDEIPVTVSIKNDSSQSTGAAVWLEKTTFSPGESITAHFTAPEGYEPDAWIGIVPSDKPHGSEAENDKYDIAFFYLAGRSSGVIKFDAPARQGNYDLRMNDAETDGREVSYTSFTVSSGDEDAPGKSGTKKARKP